VNFSSRWCQRGPYQVTRLIPQVVLDGTAATRKVYNTGQAEQSGLPKQRNGADPQPDVGQCGPATEDRVLIQRGSGRVSRDAGEHQWPAKVVIGAGSFVGHVNSQLRRRRGACARSSTTAGEPQYHQRRCRCRRSPDSFAFRHFKHEKEKKAGLSGTLNSAFSWDARAPAWPCYSRLAANPSPGRPDKPRRARENSSDDGSVA